MRRVNVNLLFEWYDYRIHSGILRFAVENDWHLTCNHHQSWMPSRITGDAFIVLPDGGRDLMQWLATCRSPVVGISANDPEIDMKRVIMDDLEIGRMAARHFIDRGFSDCAVFCFEGKHHEQLRLKGFQDSFAREGRNLHTFLHSSRTRPAPGEEASDSYVNWITDRLSSLPKPLGIFALQDEDGEIILDICSELGLSVPEEVAVLGVNNDQFICSCARVPLSSVVVPWESIGYMAAELLQRIIDGESGEIEPVTVQSPGIEERQSTNILAVADVRVAKALSYIWDNCSRKINVSNIARAAGTSSKILESLFSRHLGHGVYEEVLRYRVERVKFMLTHTDLSATEISRQLAFSSVTYMYRDFKARTGMTTKKYRNANRNK